MRRHNPLVGSAGYESPPTGTGLGSPTTCKRSAPALSLPHPVGPVKTQYLDVIGPALCRPSSGFKAYRFRFTAHFFRPASSCSLRMRSMSFAGGVLCFCKISLAPASAAFSISSKLPPEVKTMIGMCCV